jgi:hypothetical protein
MTLVLDAGALIALDRNDRALWVRLNALLQARALDRHVEVVRP